MLLVKEIRIYNRKQRLCVMNNAECLWVSVHGGLIVASQDEKMFNSMLFGFSDAGGKPKWSSSLRGGSSRRAHVVLNPFLSHCCP